MFYYASNPCSVHYLAYRFMLTICSSNGTAFHTALLDTSHYTHTTPVGLLIKYAMNLVSTDRKLEAVELFRVANKPTEAAILIGTCMVQCILYVCVVCIV